MFGSPNGPTPSEKCEKDDSGGSGPYGPAQMLEDPTMPDRTIYVPAEGKYPADQKLPIISWANGFCFANGVMFANFLYEIASHGKFTVSNKT
jgi:hypothetical protein